MLQFEGARGVGLGAGDLSHRYTWQPDAVDQLMADEQLTRGLSQFSSDENGTVPFSAGGYDLTQPGTVVWPLGDHLGTVRDLAVTDVKSGAASVANHRVYDSFGNLKSQNNAAVDCLFGFTGRAFDSATGLQNNWHRWYDAAVGQWISKDWMGFVAGDANTYRYVGNRPTSEMDPTGLWSADFHESKTKALAKLAHFTKSDELAAATKAPDFGERDCMAAYFVLQAMLDPTSTAMTTFDLKQIKIAEERLKKAAPIHFPLTDGVVEPGKGQSLAIVSNAIKSASDSKISDEKIIEAFGEGLHSLQDSYSHQGRPSQGLVGHSRSARGELVIWIALPEYPGAGGKLKWRWDYHVGSGLWSAKSASADDASIWQKDARNACLATWDQLVALYNARRSLFSADITAADTQKAVEAIWGWYSGDNP